MKTLPLPIKILIGLTALAILGYFGLSFLKSDNDPHTISYGEADVGGPFELVATDGSTFTDQDLLGKYALIYFGYTHCPDVCPLDMNRISMALAELEKAMDVKTLIQPVFITVDPARDDQKTITLFLDQYYPSFIGLTGTQAQMEKAAAAYRVYYEDMLAREHSDMDMGSEETRLINHTANIYLMGPDGKFIAYFDSSYPVSELVAALKDHLD